MSPSLHIWMKDAGPDNFKIAAKIMGGNRKEVPKENVANLMDSKEIK